MTRKHSKPSPLTRSLAAVALTVVSLWAPAADSNTGSEITPDDARFHTHGELIVRFSADFPPDERAARLALLGGDKVIGIDRNGYGRVRLREGESVTAALDRFRADPAIEHVQPNFIYRAQSIEPDDPLFDQQWALRNDGQTIMSPTYVRKIRPPAQCAISARRPHGC
jgi:hypothetical protein